MPNPSSPLESTRVEAINAEPISAEAINAEPPPMDGLALVTGGCGFIGSHIATMILDAGGRVRVLDNLSTGFEQNLDHLRSRKDVGDRLEWVRGDAADPAVCRDAVRDVQYVFHQSAMASVPRSIREMPLCHAWCTTSTVNLLDAAATSGVRRMVLASTSAIYGNSAHVSKRESDPPMPMSPYASSKLAAEAFMHSVPQLFDIETVSLRYFNVFGPRQDPASEYSAVIPRFVSMILAGRQPVIYGDGHQSRDFVYVGDVARANLIAATTPIDAALLGDAPAVFNIARGGSVTLLELLDTLGDLLGRSIDPIFEPARAGDVRDSMADITRARNVLGFEPAVDIRDGLRQSIAYYRSVAEAAAK